MQATPPSYGETANFPTEAIYAVKNAHAFNLKETMMTQILLKDVIEDKRPK